MEKIFLKIITLIHLLVVAFVVLIPFFGSNYFLLLHSVLVPFIMLHWILNNNTCALTLMEEQIRIKMNGGNPIDTKECFTAKIIHPIYDFTADNDSYSVMIYALTILLWGISVGKLVYRVKTGKIKSLVDVFNGKC